MAFSFPSVYLHDMYIDNIIIYIKYSITSKIVKCEIRQLMHSFNIHVYDQCSDIKHGGEKSEFTAIDGFNPAVCTYLVAVVADPEIFERGEGAQLKVRGLWIALKPPVGPGGESP